MKFEVPGFGEDSQLFWNVVQSGLFLRGRFTTDRQIHAVLCLADSEESVVVGYDLPGGARGDPVLVIQESSQFADMVFVQTLGGFRARREPVALALGKGWRVVDFAEIPEAAAALCRPPQPRKRGR
jgi:hypothetical protein